MKKIDFSHEQYLPIEELGRGGMGVVYKCTDRKMLNEVAVKVIGWNLSNDEVIRFHKEAKALAKLQHPNILGILHFGHSDNDSLFLVMELLSGRSLSSLIESGIVPPFEDALAIFVQICDGLAHAHRKDVLHRDIKPSNIFVERTARGDIKTTITDFGLAKLLTEDQRQTKTGIALGTPAYMSPEQAAGKTVDERSDLYSLGCLMVEVLTGQKPFDAPTIPGLIMKQVNEPPPRLNDLAPDRNYPEEIEQIVEKCLKKNPDDRYANVTELRNELNALKEISAILYGQIDHSSHSTSASRMDEFLQTGIQKKPKHTIARNTAIVAVVLALLGVIVSMIMNMNTAPIDKSVSPTPHKVAPLSGEQDVGDDEEGWIAKNIPRFNAKDPSWVQCRYKGGGAKLVDVANSAKKTNYAPDTVPYHIDARDADLTESQLATIKPIKLLGLRLDRTPITDNALKDTVSKIRTLTDLTLGGTQVTDAGIKYLTANDNLQSLNLTNTAISDESIITLSKIKSLKIIYLVNCPYVHGSTFGALPKSRSIGLCIGGSGIDPENLKLLEQSPLNFLDAARLNLTDKDLSVIAKLKNLTGLMLHGNQALTSDGLLKLKNLKKLVLLGIFNCPKIEPRAIKQLQTDLPKLQVQIMKTSEEF